jgi:spore germination protein YaaH
MVSLVFPWLVPDDPASFESLKSHADQITDVSPTWYAMTADLTVHSRQDPDVAAFARQQDIRLHPLIVNQGFDPDIAHAILATEETRQRAAEIIADLVFEGEFDGINMDFEGTFGHSRDQYTDLLRQLGDLLRPHGKWLTVDVVSQTQPASTYEVESSWAAPFDYAALGQICDRVMLMGYDYAFAEPGPVSPYWWLEEVIDWARSQIPVERIVVGLPFYTRHWIVREGKVSSPYGLKQAECARLVEQVGREPVYLEREATYRLTWNDAEGEHHVYYDDADTLHKKIQLVDQKGVRGLAFWRLGQESEDSWDAVTSSLA